MIVELILAAIIAQARIEGSVVNSQSGAPVRKVEVSIESPDREKHYFVDSAADGKFVIENIPPGDYSLTAKRFGFIEKKDHLRLDAKSDPKEMVVKLAPAGVIAGRVVDDDGDPIAEADASIERHAVDSSSTITDGEGRFLFAGLRPGRYVLSASQRPDFETSHVYLPAHYSGEIEIKPGSEFRDLEVHLRRTRAYRVSGKVSPVPGQQVRLELTTAGHEDLWRQARTEPDGTFRFANVPPGEYFIRRDTEAGDLDRATGDFIRTRSLFYCNYSVEVGNRDVSGLVVPLGPPAALRVVFRSLGLAPETPARFALTLGPGISPPPEILEDGTFRFATLAWDEYYFEIHDVPETHYIKSMQMNHEDVRRSIDLKLGGDAAMEVVLAPNPAEITATAPKPVIAFLWRGDEPGRYDVGTPRTEFTIHSLAPGEYHLLAGEGFLDRDPDDPETRKEFASYITTVTVAEGEHARVELKVIPNP